MKRIIALLLAAILCTALFGGCGQTPANSTPAEGSSGGGDNGEEVVIEYWQYFYESKVNLIDELNVYENVELPLIYLKKIPASKLSIRISLMTITSKNWRQRLRPVKDPILSIFSTVGFPNM